MTETSKVDHQIDAWKTTVEVQMHFNDIEMKVRGLGITLVTAILGAAALAIRDATEVRIFGSNIQLGSVVLAAGLVVWGAIWFVDQVWYHRLLLGAVAHGEHLEELLEESVPGIGLAKSIRLHSAYPVPILRNADGKSRTLRSNQKMNLFYGIVAGILLLLAVFAQLGAGSGTGKSATPSSGSATTTATDVTTTATTPTTAPAATSTSPGSDPP
jgi:hypothetical protein